MSHGSEWYWFDICKRIKREQTEDGRVRLWYGQYFVPERTCRNVDDEFPFFECSECGCNAVVVPNYCPNCGAKVVSE